MNGKYWQWLNANWHFLTILKFKKTYARMVLRFSQVLVCWVFSLGVFSFAGRFFQFSRPLCNFQVILHFEVNPGTRHTGSSAFTQSAKLPSAAILQVTGLIWADREGVRWVAAQRSNPSPLDWGYLLSTAPPRCVFSVEEKGRIISGESRSL